MAMAALPELLWLLREGDGEGREQNEGTGVTGERWGG